MKLTKEYMDNYKWVHPKKRKKQNVVETPVPVKEEPKKEFVSPPKSNELNPEEVYLNVKAGKPYRPSNKRTDISDTQRIRILNRDNHKCVKCGCTYNLEIHHKKPVSQGGDNSDDNLETICTDCHAKEHPEIANFILGKLKYLDDLLD